jgi:hypothetical protein
MIKDKAIILCLIVTCMSCDKQELPSKIDYSEGDSEINTLPPCVHKNIFNVYGYVRAVPDNIGEVIVAEDLTWVRIVEKDHYNYLEFICREGENFKTIRSHINNYDVDIEPWVTMVFVEDEKRFVSTGGHLYVEMGTPGNLRFQWCSVFMRETTTLAKTQSYGQFTKKLY